MTRLEFLMQLRQALTGMPAEELENAVQYYVNYLDDAGPEKEAQALQELGDPASIAKQIWEEFSEKGGSGAAVVPIAKKKRSPGLIALLVVLLVLASPFLLGLGAILFSLLVGLLAIVGSLLLAAVVLLVCFFACACGLVVCGFLTMGVHFPTALLMIGMGMLILGGVLPCGMLFVWLCKWCGKGIKALFSSIFRRRKKA